MPEKQKTPKKPTATTSPTRAKRCSAPRPTRTKEAIAAAQGPANSYIYTNAIADEICSGLAEGKPLKSICRTKGMPSIATVIAWTLDLSHPFAERYACARDIGYRHLADEILEISDAAKGDFVEDEDGRKTVDHEAIARARLRVDSRKWLLSKVLPRIYGDRVTTEHTGPNGGAIQVDVQNRVNEFLQKLDAIARRQQELKAIEAEAEQEREQRR
jgi:hypothetical protein